MHPKACRWVAQLTSLAKLEPTTTTETFLALDETPHVLGLRAEKLTRLVAGPSGAQHIYDQNMRLLFLGGLLRNDLEFKP